jgi:putative serine protease PepD
MGPTDADDRRDDENIWRRPDPDAPAAAPGTGPAEQPSEQPSEQPAASWPPAPSPSTSEPPQTPAWAGNESTPSYGAPAQPSANGGEPPSYAAVPPAAPRTDPPRRNDQRRTLRLGAGLAALVLIAGVIGGLIAHALDGGGSSNNKVTSSPVVDVSSGTTKPEEQLAKVAAAVQPSVVSITVSGSSGTDEGSGVILRSDGTVLTNNHVVEAAAGGGEISVKFADGRTAPARILGRDPTVDLAVIRARGVSGLTPATLGTTKNVHVGDTVLAIGSPLGLEGSVTSGIVSALHRTVSLGNESPSNPFGQQSSGGASVGDAIQTDAAINPGNSGGPLVDVGGRVIGINTAIASVGGGSGGGQSGNIGVGFAIPIDEAQSVANQLMQGQTPKHALLGVQVQDDPDGGALIVTVNNNGPADKAGLRSGDVVTQVDSSSVADATSLTAVIRSHQPGDKVTVHYKRGGSQRTATVTLGSAG